MRLGSFSNFHFQNWSWVKFKVQSNLPSICKFMFSQRTHWNRKKKPFLGWIPNIHYLGKSHSLHLCLSIFKSFFVFPLLSPSSSIPRCVPTSLFHHWPFLSLFFLSLPPYVLLSFRSHYKWGSWKQQKDILCPWWSFIEGWFLLPPLVFSCLCWGTNPINQLSLRGLWEIIIRA